MTKEGDRRTVLLSAGMVKDSDGKVLHSVSMQRDITQRKRAEREIEERRVYLEEVLRAAPDAIVTLDASHRIVEWNPGAERLFGHSREEVMGQDIDHVVTNPDTLEEAVQRAHEGSQRGDVVLLSPACSSFDMFQDYEERGNSFKEIVNQLDRENRKGDRKP